MFFQKLKKNYLFYSYCYNHVHLTQNLTRIFHPSQLSPKFPFYRIREQQASGSNEISSQNFISSRTSSAFQKFPHMDYARAHWTWGKMKITAAIQKRKTKACQNIPLLPCIHHIRCPHHHEGTHSTSNPIVIDTYVEEETNRHSNISKPKICHYTQQFFID